MISESITHEALSLMSYGLRDHEGERNNCFTKIQLVGQKSIETKHLSLVKARPFLPPKHYKHGQRFSLIVGYDIYYILLNYFIQYFERHCLS